MSVLGMYVHCIYVYLYINRPLERMVVGMLLAGSAFMVAGFIQLDVQVINFI